MSSQEPPYREQPGERPRQEREINYDPREQPRSEFVAPETPPPGYQPPQGYPPPQGYYGPAAPPRRRRGRLFACLITLLVVLLLCIGLSLVGAILGLGVGIARVFRNGVTEAPRTFTVSGSPALILTSDAGSVTVKSGSTNSIIVQATKYAGFGGNSNDVQVNYSQSGSTVNVTFHRSGAFNFFNAINVDFTITVPSSTNLQVTTSAGSINVSGVSGEMSLISNAGTIGATSASLTGSSTFKTNAGSINFNGSIGTTGTYDFETNAGSIDMTLPGTTSFHVNATTDAGSINTSFPVSVNRSGDGATVNNDVGSAPQATLTLKTNAGSINLNKGS
jgi:hypothetical protein